MLRSEFWAVKSRAPRLPHLAYTSEDREHAAGVKPPNARHGVVLAGADLVRQLIPVAMTPSASSISSSRAR